MAKKFIPNNTDKEERAYEPFQGAKSNFIKELEKKEKEKAEEENN
jgi:hypothetical protein